MKPFLILQLRPEDAASDEEFGAFLSKGGLRPDQARRIRLDSEALPPDLDLGTFSGVIVGGGPGCVSDAPEDKSETEARIEAAILSLMPQITARDLPFLGCCYGIGILGRHLGAPVTKDHYGEPVGAVTCTRMPDGAIDPLLDGPPAHFDAFVGHKEALDALPPDTVALLTSAPCPFQMIRHKRNVYATQFHPEADSAGFALRIRLYRNRGYFAPAAADDLIAMCARARVRWPERILANFVARYGVRTFAEGLAPSPR